MMRRRTFLAAAGAAAAGPVIGGPAQAALALAPGGDAARLLALMEESEQARRALDPLGALRQGLEPTGSAFVDPLSDAYAAAQLAAAERDLAGLSAISRAALPAADRIAYDVFRYRAERLAAHHRSGLFAIERTVPLNASFGLHVGFPDLVATRPSDGAVGVERLHGFAGHLDTVVERLREGMGHGRVQPRVTAEGVLRQLDAMLAVPAEQSPFLAMASESDREGYRRAVETRVYPAYRRWRDFLAETYLPAATEAPGRWAAKDGRALYAADLARHTTTAMSAYEIHATGLGEVERIRGEMERVRRKAGFAGDLPAMFEHVRTDPGFYYSDPADLLRHFAEIEARIWPAMPRLFSRRPAAPFEVRPLPAHGGERGTGYYRAGPADGSGPGILYFNMAMLGTRPIPTLETLTLHEGIPGHHYQISLTQENAALPPILRFGSATAYSEGWGLYAESLGHELGLFEDPWQWFGRLDMEMLRAVRLVVDTGLHEMEWSRQRAIDYMLANTSMAPRDVAVEIDRYISVPGQAAAYKVGELRIQALRRDAERRLAGRFDPRAFHDQVLDTGALPLAVLEAKIGGWLDAVA